MMGGVSPETCWASHNYGMINFDTLLHLVGFFCTNIFMTLTFLYEHFYDYYFSVRTFLWLLLFCTNIFMTITFLYEHFWLLLFCTNIFMTITFPRDIRNSSVNRHKMKAKDRDSIPRRWRYVPFSGMPRQALELIQLHTMNYSVSNDNSCSWRIMRVWNADCRLRYKHDIRGTGMTLRARQ